MKSRRSTTASTGGIGLLDVILIVNIILNLLKVSTIATWTWAAVLWPLWIELGFLAIAIIIVIILITIVKR